MTTASHVRTREPLTLIRHYEPDAARQIAALRAVLALPAPVPTTPTTSAPTTSTTPATAPQIGGDAR